MTRGRSELADIVCGCCSTRTDKSRKHHLDRAASARMYTASRSPRRKKGKQRSNTTDPYHQLKFHAFGAAQSMIAMQMLSDSDTTSAGTRRKVVSQVPDPNILVKQKHETNDFNPFADMQFERENNSHHDEKEVSVSDTMTLKARKSVRPTLPKAMVKEMVKIGDFNVRNYVFNLTQKISHKLHQTHHQQEIKPRKGSKASTTATDGGHRDSIASVESYHGWQVPREDAYNAAGHRVREFTPNHEPEPEFDAKTMPFHALILDHVADLIAETDSDVAHMISEHHELSEYEEDMKIKKNDNHSKKPPSTTLPHAMKVSKQIRRLRKENSDDFPEYIATPPPESSVGNNTQQIIADVEDSVCDGLISSSDPEPSNLMLSDESVRGYVSSTDMGSSSDRFCEAAMEADFLSANPDVEKQSKSDEMSAKKFAMSSSSDENVQVVEPSSTIQDEEKFWGLPEASWRNPPKNWHPHDKVENDTSFASDVEQKTISSPTNKIKLQGNAVYSSDNPSSDESKPESSSDDAASRPRLIRQPSPPKAAAKSPRGRGKSPKRGVVVPQDVKTERSHLLDGLAQHFGELLAPAVEDPVLPAPPSPPRPKPKPISTFSLQHLKGDLANFKRESRRMSLENKKKRVSSKNTHVFGFSTESDSDVNGIQIIHTDTSVEGLHFREEFNSFASGLNYMSDLSAQYSDPQHGKGQSRDDTHAASPKLNQMVKHKKELSLTTYQSEDSDNRHGIYERLALQAAFDEELEPLERQADEEFIAAQLQHQQAEAAQLAEKLAEAERARVAAEEEANRLKEIKSLCAIHEEEEKNAVERARRAKDAAAQHDLDLKRIMESKLQHEAEAREVKLKHENSIREAEQRAAVAKEKFDAQVAKAASYSEEAQRKASEHARLAQEQAEQELDELQRRLAQEHDLQLAKVQCHVQQAEMARSAAEQAYESEQAKLAEIQSLRQQHELDLQHAEDSAKEALLRKQKLEEEAAEAKVRHEESIRFAESRAEERKQALQLQQRQLEEEKLQQEDSLRRAEKEVHRAKEEISELNAAKLQEQSSLELAKSNAQRAQEDAAKFQDAKLIQEKALLRAQDNIHRAESDLARLQAQRLQEEKDSQRANQTKVQYENSLRAAQERADSVKQELAQLQQDKVRQEESLLRAEKQAERIKQEVAQIEDAKLKREDSLHKARQSANDAKAVAANLHAEKVRQEQSLVSKLARLHAQRMEHEKDVESAKQAKLRHEHSLQQAQSTLQTTKTEVAQIQAAKLQHESSLQRAEQNAERARQEAAELEKEKVRQEESLRRAEQDAERARQEAAALQESRQLAEKEIESAEQRTRRAQETAQQAKEHASKLENEKIKHEEALKFAEAAAERAQQEVQSLEESKAETEASLRIAQETIQRMQQEAAALAEEKVKREDSLRRAEARVRKNKDAATLEEVKQKAMREELEAQKLHRENSLRRVESEAAQAKIAAEKLQAERQQADYDAQRALQIKLEHENALRDFERKAEEAQQLSAELQSQRLQEEEATELAKRLKAQHQSEQKQEELQLTRIKQQRALELRREQEAREAKERECEAHVLAAQARKEEEAKLAAARSERELHERKRQAAEEAGKLAEENAARIQREAEEKAENLLRSAQTQAEQARLNLAQQQQLSKIKQENSDDILVFAGQVQESNNEDDHDGQQLSLNRSYPHYDSALIVDSSAPDSNLVENNHHVGDTHDLESHENPISLVHDTVIDNLLDQTADVSTDSDHSKMLPTSSDEIQSITNGDGYTSRESSDDKQQLILSKKIQAGQDKSNKSASRARRKGRSNSPKQRSKSSSRLPKHEFSPTGKAIFSAHAIAQKINSSRRAKPDSRSTKHDASLNVHLDGEESFVTVHSDIPESFAPVPFFAKPVADLEDGLEAVVELAEDTYMPVLGLSTANVQEDAILSALHSGICWVDVTNQKEDAVGSALIKSGKGRNEYFISCEVADEDISGTVSEMMRRLDTDHIDLVFLPMPSDGKLFDCYLTLLAAQKKGTVGSVGVCEYGVGELTTLKNAKKRLPTVNRMSINPSNWKEKESILKFCRQHGIKIAVDTMAEFTDTEEIILDIAKRYDKSSRQIIFRWYLQMGFCVLPCSSNKNELRQDQDVFDFELSNADMGQICALSSY